MQIIKKKKEKLKQSFKQNIRNFKRLNIIFKYFYTQ